MASFVHKLDLLLGLRAWGVLLYSTIPANLVLLGSSKLQLNQWIWVPLVAATVLPCFVLFLLIRGKHRQWYLTTDLLNTRSFITTAASLALVSSMCGCMGILNGTYKLGWPPAWTLNAWTPVAECILLGGIGLIISSTLSMTALAKADDLPGMPSAKMIQSIEVLRQNLIKLHKSNIWQEWTQLDDLDTILATLRDELRKIEGFSSDNLIKESLTQVVAQITAFDQAIQAIRDGVNEQAKQIQWQIHFAPVPLEEVFQAHREAIADRFKRLADLKQLRLGA